ncbi:hypothetical protein Lal_00028488 [Lupinus albus]|nr:hypothetical protein Lal_00028488 [Lupinus albus]
MDFRMSSTLKLTILLVFFIIASDMCMKSDAREGGVVTLPCQNDQQCKSYPRCNQCGCKCIVGTGCRCSTSSLNDNIHTQTLSTIKL